MSEEAKNLNGNEAAAELVAHLAEEAAAAKATPPMDVTMKEVGNTRTFRVAGRRITFVRPESGGRHKLTSVEREA